MKKTWLQNSDNHLEDHQLVDVAAATKKIIDKIQVSTEKRPNSKNNARRWSLVF